jgi:hypothetical protein
VRLGVIDSGIGHTRLKIEKQVLDLYVIPQFVILKYGFHIGGNAPPVPGAKASAFSE